jgi:CCT motif
MADVMPPLVLPSCRARGFSIALEDIAATDKLSHLEIDSLIADEAMEWAEEDSAAAAAEAGTAAAAATAAATTAAPSRKGSVHIADELLTPDDWRVDKERGMSIGGNFDLFCEHDAAAATAAAASAKPSCTGAGSSSTCCSESTDGEFEHEEHDIDPQDSEARVISSSKRKRCDSMSRMLAITGSDSDGDSAFTDSLDELDGIEDLSAEADAAGYSSLPFDSMQSLLPGLKLEAVEQQAPQHQHVYGSRAPFVKQELHSAAAVKPEATPYHYQNYRAAQSSLCSSGSSSSEGAVTRAAVQLNLELPNVPRDGQHRIGAYTPAERAMRVAKFHSKRARRIWRKKIKYDCRKKLADQRPRVKGRFVTAKSDAPPCTLASINAAAEARAAAAAAAAAQYSYSSGGGSVYSDDSSSAYYPPAQPQQQYQQQPVQKSYKAKAEPRVALSQPVQRAAAAAASVAAGGKQEPVRLGRGARNATRARTNYGSVLQ